MKREKAFEAIKGLGLNELQLNTITDIIENLDEKGYEIPSWSEDITSFKVLKDEVAKILLKSRTELISFLNDIRKKDNISVNEILLYMNYINDKKDNLNKIIKQ